MTGVRRRVPDTALRRVRGLHAADARAHDRARSRTSSTSTAARLAFTRRPRLRRRARCGRSRPRSGRTAASRAWRRRVVSCGVLRRPRARPAAAVARRADRRPAGARSGGAAARVQELVNCAARRRGTSRTAPAAVGARSRRTCCATARASPTATCCSRSPGAALLIDFGYDMTTGLVAGHRAHGAAAAALAARRAPARLRRRPDRGRDPDPLPRRPRRRHQPAARRRGHRGLGARERRARPRAARAVRPAVPLVRPDPGRPVAAARRYRSPGTSTSSRSTRCPGTRSTRRRSSSRSTASACSRRATSRPGGERPSPQLPVPQPVRGSTTTSRSAELYRALRPDLIISGHWLPREVTDDVPRRARGRRRAARRAAPRAAAARRGRPRARGIRRAHRAVPLVACAAARPVVARRDGAQPVRPRPSVGAASRSSCRRGWDEPAAASELRARRPLAEASPLRARDDGRGARRARAASPPTSPSARSGSASRPRRWWTIT